MDTFVRPRVIAALMAAAFALEPAVSADAIPDELLVWGNKNFGRLLVRASNEEATEFARVFSDTAAYLAKSSPEKCMRMVMPSVHGPLSREDWPAVLLDRQMAVQRSIVRTALTAPKQPPSESQAGPVFDSVFQKLKVRYGAEEAKLLTRTDKNVPAKETCVAWGHLYKELSELPPDQGGMVVRWLNAP